MVETGLEKQEAAMRLVSDNYAAQLAATFSQLQGDFSHWIRIRQAVDLATERALSMYQLDLLSDMVEAHINRMRGSGAGRGH